MVSVEGCRTWCFWFPSSMPNYVSAERTRHTEVGPLSGFKASTQGSRTKSYITANSRIETALSGEQSSNEADTLAAITAPSTWLLSADDRYSLEQVPWARQFDSQTSQFKLGTKWVSVCMGLAMARYGTKPAAASSELFESSHRDAWGSRASRSARHE